MIKFFGKLVNRRQFSTKDSLQQKFKKLTELNNTSTQHTNLDTDNIKLTDHQKITDQLKNKFEEAKQNLEKNTGESKTTYQRIVESFRNFDPSKISLSTLDPKKNQQKTDETEAKATSTVNLSEKIEKKDEINPTSNFNLSENIEKSEQNSEKTSESKASKPKQKPLNKKPVPKVPYLTQIEQLSPATSKIIKNVVELYKETFPTERDKILKLHKFYQEKNLSKELDEKIARGEISIEDVPEWKRNALTVLPEKLTVWKKVKKTLGVSKLNGLFKGKSDQVLSSSSIKQAKTKIKELKDGISDVKNLVKDSLDDSENKIYHSAKDALSGSLLETTNAKAARILKLYDPDFNLFSMEEKFPIFLKDLLLKMAQSDAQYIKSVCSDQALSFCMGHLEHWKSHGLTPEPDSASVKIVSSSYSGANIDDKSRPKLSYRVEIIIENSLKNDELGRIPFFLQGHYVVSITGHPDPNILMAKHPWQFVLFVFGDELTRLT
jgi:hypothetical protein